MSEIDTRPDGVTDEDWEFVQTVAAFYRNELKRTGNPSAASKATERFRSALIVGRAEAAVARRR